MDTTITISEWHEYYDIRTVIQNSLRTDKLQPGEQILGITHTRADVTKDGTTKVLTAPVFIVGKPKDDVVEALEKELDLTKFKLVEKENLAKMQLDKKLEAHKKIEEAGKRYAELKLRNIALQHEHDNMCEYAQKLEDKLADLGTAIGRIKFEEIVGDMPVLKEYTPGSIDPKLEHIPVQ